MRLRTIAASVGAAMIVAATPILAMPPRLSPGMTVMDTSGGQVGSIESVTADNAVIATGAHKVAVPVTSFGMGPNGPVIAMTKGELDNAAATAAANAAAALRAQMLPGVAIFGSQGANLGTIKAVDGDYLVLATAAGDARLPLAAIASGQKGLTVNMTAVELNAAISPTS
ncbi:hypothetical protein [Sphingomonas montanisoli]|uniref:Uncharacterized protein n=1 Tax=Sphingomonas montanisoli TaxID=2606412 RepID=A0A5D9C840_9SPHN|nr:hypothetical protein [Sphingomonas montanisoli]TZG27292.1 hypothetical protein FYJ91_06650 [Sphingomonas montanisoli]